MGKLLGLFVFYFFLFWWVYTVDIFDLDKPNQEFIPELEFEELFPVSIEQLAEEMGFEPQCKTYVKVEKEEFVDEYIDDNCLLEKVLYSCTEVCFDESDRCLLDYYDWRYCDKVYYRCNDECYYNYEEIQDNKLEAKKVGCLNPSYINTWNETICTGEILVRVI